MKLKVKILLSYLVLLALILTLSLLGVFFVTSNNVITKESKINQTLVLAYNDAAFQTVRANAAVRGYMLYQEDSMKENHYQIREQLHNAINQIKQSGEQNDEFTVFLNKLESWEKAIDNDILPVLEAGNIEEAKKIASPILGKGSKELIEFAKKMATEQSSLLTQKFDSMGKDGDIMLILVLIISIIAILIALFLSFVFGRKVSNSIQQVVDKINRFANGDFKVQLHINSKDEFGELSHSFNQMTKKLKDMMNNINLSSQQVAATSEQLNASSYEVSHASQEISQSILDISEGLKDQNKMTTEVHTLSNEILAEMNRILENVQIMDTSVKLADEVSENGKNHVSQVVEQMDSILKKTDKITSHIHELSHQTNTISKIITVIKEIAEQTNLLALNASIEAARAGEHGKGFAIVAEEVRKLAVESNKAAGQIEEVVGTIMSKTNSMVSEIEDNDKSVHLGKKRVDATGQLFNDILKSVSNVHHQSKQVNTSIQQVFSNLETLVADMNKMTEISNQSTGSTQNVASAAQEQSASMQEVATASNELSQLANQLQDSIQAYKF